MKLLNIGPKRAFKQALYEEFARVATALANPHRLELLDLLSQREERSVDDVAAEAGLSIANASQHLKALRSARLVEVRREGTFAYYRIASSEVVELWHRVRDMATARSPEVRAIVERHVGTRDEPLRDIDDLLSRVERGELLLLDARPNEEYRSGHIPGARLLPSGELQESFLASLDTQRDIVVYCRGPYCTFADEAVTVLRERGLRAQRLELGVPEWRQLGFAVAVGENAGVDRG